MSKAPGTASQYDGSGGWFKINDWGPTFSGGQASWPLAGSYTYNIPSCLADGEYLLRIQSIGIHNPWPGGTPQFYVSCAQIKLTGGGKANPPAVKIPGVFKATDPGYTANVSFSCPLTDLSWNHSGTNGQQIYTNFNSYTIPGPEVWKCGDATSTAPSETEESTEEGSTGALPQISTFITQLTSATPTPTLEPEPEPEPEVEVPTCESSKYQQCGGIGFSGCTNCADGSTCFRQNDYYSQCV